MWKGGQSKHRGLLLVLVTCFLGWINTRREISRYKVLSKENAIVLASNHSSTVSSVDLPHGTETVATNCLLRLEKVLNDTLIDQWLRDRVPMVEKVIAYDDEGVVRILLNTEHLNAAEHGKRYWFDNPHHVQWFCGGHHSTTPRRAHPENFSHKARVSILSCPMTWNATIATKLADSLSRLWAVNTASNETLVSYDIQPFLRCEALETRQQTRHPNITLAACAIFRGDTARSILHEWIVYHHLIGVQHFWIYVNEPWSVVHGPSLPQLDYVTYVPYNFYWAEHAHHSNYRLPHLAFWQEPMQFQCLYRAKKLKIPWIMTTEVDEYVWVAPNNETRKSLTERQSQPVLRDFLDRVMARPGMSPNVGGLEMNSIPYGRNPRLSEGDDDNSTDTSLVMDHVWRDKQDPQSRRRDRVKMIYHVPMAQSVGVHYLWSGGRKVPLDPDTDAFVRHYKRSDTGVFQSPDPDDLIRDTELFDAYHDVVVRAMNATKA